MEELLAAARNRQLTPEQAARLNALLVSDPTMRKAYVQHMHLEASLHHLLGESIPGPGDTQSLVTAFMEVGEQPLARAVAEEAANPLEEGEEVAEGEVETYQLPEVAVTCSVSGGRRRFARAGMWLAAACVLLMAGATVFILSRHPAAVSPVAVGGTQPGETMLAAAINATWEEPVAGLLQGQALPGSVVKLRRGAMRLDAPHGVTVIVQAPAEFQMDSASHLTLQRGSMTAHVPPEGVGFTVATPQARVQDLGTEFGVFVDGDSRTHAEVFTGKVQVSIDDGKRTLAARVLQANDAVEIPDGAITMQAVNLQPLAFLRPEQFASIARASGNLPYARWAAYSSALRQEKDVLAYYTFDNEAESPMKLLNVAAGTAGRADGTLDGATWDDGRFAAKRSLRFDGKSRVHINIPESTKPLTVTAWVNFESFIEPPSPRDHQFMGIMLSDGSRQSAVHWQIMDGHRMELSIGVNNDDPVPFERYRTPNVISADNRNKWTMLAVVFDRENAQVRHYINGKQTNISPIIDAPDPQIGDAQIGNWDQVGQHYRGLVGRIDELAIIGRAMSRQEIEAMYAAGGGN